MFWGSIKPIPHSGSTGQTIRKTITHDYSSRVLSGDSVSSGAGYFSHERRTSGGSWYDGD